MRKIYFQVRDWLAVTGMNGLSPDKWKWKKLKIGYSIPNQNDETTITWECSTCYNLFNKKYLNRNYNLSKSGLQCIDLFRNWEKFSLNIIVKWIWNITLRIAKVKVLSHANDGSIDISDWSVGMFIPIFNWFRIFAKIWVYFANTDWTTPNIINEDVYNWTITIHLLAVLIHLAIVKFVTFKMPEYGKGYIKTPIGIFKIIEIIFCIVILALIGEGTSRYYGLSSLHSAITGAGVTGLILSLLILILSIACGQDLDSVLKWQCIVHFLLMVWFLITGIFLVIRDPHDRNLILAIIGIVTGVVYLIDAILSYKDYKPF